jgi:nitroreductase
MAVLQKHAETSAPVHDIIGKRWSPRAFDSRPVEPAKLRSLFEAARWAASSYNAQPWYFLVASKDEHEGYKKILESFVEFNQGWAKSAPVLAISVAELKFAHNGDPNRHAFHDVGQAAATLALEAANLGLQVHQMAGILPDKAKQLFHIPDGYEAVAGIAIGYPGDPNSLPEQLRAQEHSPRQRKALDSFVFDGDWGKPSPIVAKK